MNKSVCISFPMGCCRSMMDAARLVEYFKANEWDIIQSIAKADLVLIGTCGLNMQHENMSHKYISIVNEKKRGDVSVVAFGCLAGIAGEKLREKQGVHLITRQSMNRLDSVINAKVSYDNIQDPNDLKQYDKYICDSFSKLDWIRAKCTVEPSVMLSRLIGSMVYRFNKGSSGSAEFSRLYDIRISSGCLGICTYCAIRFECGPLRSKSLSAIIKEFQRGLANGYKDFRLLAEDVGSYGQDLHLSIVDLFTAIYSHPGDFKLVVNDFSPKWFLKYRGELLGILPNNNGRLGYIALPVQSGSDRILKLMKRGYSSLDLRDAILELKRLCPQVAIVTHLIIGFPGEEECDFRQSLDFVKSLPLERVLLFKYADRPGTVSSCMENKVSDRIINERKWAVMRALKPGKVEADF